MEGDSETKANEQASSFSPRSDLAHPQHKHPVPKQSLQHILASTDPPVRPESPSPREQSLPAALTRGETSNKAPISKTGDEADATEDQQDPASVQNDSYTRAAEFNPSHTMTVAHTRRNANGTIGSVYSGNKIRHLKKEDGIPLWRKDIQLEFLRCVFEDDTPVFTKAFDNTGGHTFADVYVDAMARSSKTSKILKEKLLADRGAAMHMAMICLLVNVGRMNTTLNFFPEMRAQLRTYHSIPSLQANRDPNAYKQLQDAPRLKSILKGASEDASQPSTIDKIMERPIPRTNPVNLIFVLSQYAPKVSEVHFDPPRDFFDLVMRSTLSSKSRARAFLWLVWFYLESDFSPAMALQNPFGPGRVGNDGGEPFKVPTFDHLTEAQADAENVDTEEEKAYGEMKRQERIRILQEDETVGPPLKKAKKNPTEELNFVAISDNDPTRSPSPSAALQMKSSHDPHDPTTLNGTSQIATPSLNRIAPPLNRSYSNPQRLVLKTRVDNFQQSSSPVPPGSGHPTFHATSNGMGSRRPRPETSHQKAVNVNRKMRINHILRSKIQHHHKVVRAQRSNNRSSFGLLVMNRVKELPDMYDSDEENVWGPGGLLPSRYDGEDFGEEALFYKKAIDRAARRLHRQESTAPTGDGVTVKQYHKGKRKGREYASEEKQGGSHMIRRHNELNRTSAFNGHRQESGLDDLDLALLGEGQDEDEEMMDDESGINDSLDVTEDEVMDEA